MESKKLLEQVMRNIRDRRLSLKMSQGKLADKCGWENAGGRVSNYENLSREPSLADIDRMARAVGSSIKEVLFENFSVVDGSSQLQYITLPLLVADEVIPWVSGTLSQSTRSFNMYISGIEPQDKLFVLIAEGDAMISEIPTKKSIFDGDVLLIKMDMEPVNNDIVIVKTEGGIKVRQFVKDGSEKFLRAFNKDYPRLEISKEVEIIGVVIQRHVNYREITRPPQLSSDISQKVGGVD